MTDYVASNEWMVLDSPAVKNIKYYPCCHRVMNDVSDVTASCRLIERDAR